MTLCLHLPGPLLCTEVSSCVLLDVLEQTNPTSGSWRYELGQVTLLTLGCPFKSNWG